MEGEVNVQRPTSSSTSVNPSQNKGLPSHENGHPPDGFYGPPAYQNSLMKRQCGHRDIQAGDDADISSEQSSEMQDATVIRRQRAKRLTVATLITSLAMIGYTIFSDSYNQWLYIRFQQQVLGSNYSLLNKSKSNNPCLKINETIFFEKELDVAQERASFFISLTMIASLFPALIINLLFGPYIDYIGRKPYFIAPTTGLIIKTLITWAVCFWDLDLNLLFIGLGVEGLTGSLGTLVMALFVYAADNTKAKESRSLGMVAIQTVIVLALALTRLAVGIFISAEGYMWPLATSCLLMALACLGYIGCLDETLQISKRIDFFNPIEGVKRAFSFYLLKNTNIHHKRKDYVYLAITFFLFGTCLGASIQTLYLMDKPFCWTSTKIGYATTFQALLQSFAPLPLVWFLQKYMKDDIICTIALLITAGGKIIFSFADSDRMLYLGFVATFLELSVLSIIRAIFSRMVPLKYRGSLFSSIAAIEIGTFAASGAGLTTLYSETVSLWKGLTYFVIGVCMVIASIVMIIYAVTIRIRISQIKDDDSQFEEVDAHNEDQRPLVT